MNSTLHNNAHHTQNKSYPKLFVKLLHTSSLLIPYMVNESKMNHFRGRSIIFDLPIIPSPSIKLERIPKISFVDIPPHLSILTSPKYTVESKQQPTTSGRNRSYIQTSLVLVANEVACTMAGRLWSHFKPIKRYFSLEKVFYFNTVEWTTDSLALAAIEYALGSKTQSQTPHSAADADHPPCYQAG